MLTQEAIFIATIKGTSLVIKTRPLTLFCYGLYPGTAVAQQYPEGTAVTYNCAEEMQMPMNTCPRHIHAVISSVIEIYVLL